MWIDDENVDDAVQHAERLMHYARIQKNTVITERQPEPHALQPTHSRQSVLIVDDSAMNRMLLSQMLNSQFDTAEAASGEDCLRLLEQNPTGISVVLLDIHMTGIDGFTVLEAMSQRGMLEEIPVIMISSEDNVDTVRRAFDLGASDYISRPFDARVVYQRITNTIRMYAKQRRLSAMVADQVSQKEKRSQMMIGILSRVVERRNGESRTHVQHISTLTGMLLDHLVQKTETYPLTQEMRRTISMASVLHDIGKMEIGEQVLNSPEPRTPEDEETMRQHTLLGARMLEELDAYRDEDFVAGSLSDLPLAPRAVRRQRLPGPAGWRTDPHCGTGGRPCGCLRNADHWQRKPAAGTLRGCSADALHRRGRGVQSGAAGLPAGDRERDRRCHASSAGDLINQTGEQPNGKGPPVSSLSRCETKVQSLPAGAGCVTL